MKSKCLEYEILISAAVDGELEDHEFDRLESHVDQCPACLHQYKTLETLNRWLIRHDRTADSAKTIIETSARSESVIPLPATVNGVNHHSRKPVGRSSVTRSHPPRIRKRTFIAGGALAAAGLASLLISGQSNPLPTMDSGLGELSNSVSRMTELAHRRQQDQASQTQAMDYEFRALRLELRNSKGSEEELQSIAERLGELQKRLDHLNNTNLISFHDEL